MPPSGGIVEFGGVAKSGEADSEAGSGSLDARDLLDRLGDSIAEPVQVVRFELDDDVVRSCDGIDRGDASTGVGELRDGSADGFRLADIGFDKDVASYGHSSLLTSDNLGASSFCAARRRVKKAADHLTSRGGGRGRSCPFPGSSRH